MAKARDFDSWATEVARELASLGVPVLEAKHIPYDKQLPRSQAGRIC